MKENEKSWLNHSQQAMSMMGRQPERKVKIEKVPSANSLWNKWILQTLFNGSHQEELKLPNCQKKKTKVNDSSSCRSHKKYNILKKDERAGWDIDEQVSNLNHNQNQTIVRVKCTFTEEYWEDRTVQEASMTYKEETFYNFNWMTIATVRHQAKKRKTINIPIRNAAGE